MLFDNKRSQDLRSIRGVQFPKNIEKLGLKKIWLDMRHLSRQHQNNELFLARYAAQCKKYDSKEQEDLYDRQSDETDRIFVAKYEKIRNMQRNGNKDYSISSNRGSRMGNARLSNGSTKGISTDNGKGSTKQIEGASADIQLDNLTNNCTALGGCSM